MGLSGIDQKYLGLQTGSTSLLWETPLFRHFFAMKKTYMTNKKPSDNKDVSYRSSYYYTALFFASNHAYMGLEIDIIEAYFYALPLTAFPI